MSTLQDIKQKVQYLNQANNAFKQLQNPLTNFCSVAKYDPDTHHLKIHVSNQQFVLALKMQHTTLLQALKNIAFFREIKDISFKYFETDIKAPRAPKSRTDIESHQIALDQLSYIKSKLQSEKF